MPAQFDWQAEDDKEWGDFEPENKPSPDRWRPSRRLVVVLLALVIAAGVTLVTVTQVDRFLDGNARQTEQALLNGHQLVLDAGGEDDGELLGGLIFDRMVEWTDAQMLLTDKGLLLDRYALDLHLGGNGQPVSTEVEMEPSQRLATVTTTWRYRVGAEDASTDFVSLRQVFSYRYQDERWLLNPPTGAFWGAWRSISGRYLTLNYPERDEAIAQQLAADLEATLGQACYTVEAMNCRPDLRLEVDLLADPSILVDLTDPAWQLSGGLNVDLPTPTLIGLPADEAAYRALYRVYAERVVARLVTEQTGVAGGQQPLLAIAFSDLILDRLGLRAFPPPADALVYGGETIYDRTDALWNSGQMLGAETEEFQTAHALVHFLTSEWSEIPIPEMARLLAEAQSLPQWLAMLNPKASGTGFVAAWNRYVTETAPAPEPEAWPDEIVLLMCDPGIVGSAKLYQYDPAKQIVSVLVSGREFIRMEPLPEGDGILFTEQLISQDGQRMFLWRHGQLRPYEAGDGQLGGEGDPDHRDTGLSRTARQTGMVAMSSDGRWSAELGDEFLIISAPELGFRRLVAHGGQECQGLAWVQKTPDGAEP